MFFFIIYASNINLVYIVSKLYKQENINNLLGG